MIDSVWQQLTAPHRLQQAEFAAIFRQVEQYAGRVVAIEEMRSGNVSHVYKVLGAEQTVFVKIRGDRFARLPTISTDPTHISYEWRALELFGKLVPGVFPRVLAFDAQRCCLVLTDVFHQRANFEDKLNALRANVADMELLGRTLGVIHRATRHITRGIRPDDDQTFRDNSLRYCLEDSHHPVLIELSSRYKQQQRYHLIIGDPSPKNMSVGDDEIGICDLDNAHIGSHMYDLAYVMAHMLLHHLQHLIQARYILKTLQQSYLDRNPIDIEPDILIQTIIGMMMYRLNNQVVPYRLTLTTLQRMRYYHLCTAILYRQIRSIDELLTALEV